MALSYPSFTEITLTPQKGEILLQQVPHLHIIPPKPGKVLHHDTPHLPGTANQLLKARTVQIPSCVSVIQKLRHAKPDQILSTGNILPSKNTQEHSRHKTVPYAWNRHPGITHSPHTRTLRSGRTSFLSTLSIHPANSCLFRKAMPLLDFIQHPDYSIPSYVFEFFRL